MSPADSTRTDSGHRNRQHQSSQAGGGLKIGLAIGALAAIGLAAYVALSDDPTAAFAPETAVPDARPVGAGTLPDGEADEYNEGLLNETDRGDFIAPGAPTDASPNPLLDIPDGERPTVPSIEDLNPGPAIDDAVLDNMAPGTDAAAPFDED